MENLDEIFKIENRTELIDKCVNYITEEYINHGGDIKNTDNEFTMWTLEGIYERDGKSGLKEFMYAWKPRIPKIRWQVYAQ